MNRQRCGWLLLASGICLCTTTPLAGQVSPAGGVSLEKRERSHVSLPQGGSSRATLEKLLKDRLGRAEDANQAHQLLEQLLKDPQRYFSEDQLRALKDRLRLDDPKQLETLDPALKEAIRQWAEKQKQQAIAEGKLPPEKLESLQRLLNEPPPPPIPPGSLPPPGGLPPPPPPGANLPPEITQPTPAEQERDVQLRQRMLNLAERFLDSSGRGSSVLRRAGSDLRERRFPQAENWLRLRERTEGLRSRMPELRESLHLDDLLRESGGLLRNRPSLPDVGTWRPGQGGGGPSPGGLAAVDSSSGSGWQVLLWFVLGLALLVLLWKIVTSQRRPADGVRPLQPLGPWPVQPSAVTTREELVRAFEYLTLLCLGPAARCWNHLQIADQLSGHQQLDRREAAAQLARLYEQARYAPSREPLPAADLVAARRHLCFLAGVSAA